ncbi:MAG: hypothetical protein GY838_18830 [bacterium]|nr:hypothetical protein [bacterium]
MAAGRSLESVWQGRLPGPVEMGRGRTAVRLELLPQGRDLVLLVGGGGTHVGAVAAADGETVRALTLGIHKEGPLAEEAATRVATAAGCSCAVVAGIHQDDAMPEEIAAMVANVEAGVTELVAALTGKGRG